MVLSNGPVICSLNVHNHNECYINAVCTFCQISTSRIEWKFTKFSKAIQNNTLLASCIACRALLFLWPREEDTRKRQFLSQVETLSEKANKSQKRKLILHGCDHWCRSHKSFRSVASSTTPCQRTHETSFREILWTVGIRAQFWLKLSTCHRKCDVAYLAGRGTLEIKQSLVFELQHEPKSMECWR